MTNEYWLHYIGKGLYSKDSFELEATRIGVQRAIPFYMLKAFKWGDIILLAHWSKSEAQVFGYFALTSVTHNLPKEINDELLEKLEVTLILQPNNAYENRQCGAYFNGAIAYINNSIEDIEREAIKVCGKVGASPNEFKWFLKGYYKPLEQMVILKPAKFTRGYLRTKIQDLNLKTLPQEEHGSLIWIYNYQKRTYLRKGDKSRINSRSLLEYL